MKEKKYLTFEELANLDTHPFTAGQLRAFLVKRKENGFDKCVRKIGKRIYIREDLFYEWIECYGLE